MKTIRDSSGLFELTDFDDNEKTAFVEHLQGKQREIHAEKGKVSTENLAPAVIEFGLGKMVETPYNRDVKITKGFILTTDYMNYSEFNINHIIPLELTDKGNDLCNRITSVLMDSMTKAEQDILAELFDSQSDKAFAWIDQKIAMGISDKGITDLLRAMVEKEK